LIGEGGMIELEVPSNLAYGDEGQLPFVPPKATLHFLIELLKIQDAPAPVEERSVPTSTTPGPDDPDASKEFTTTASGLKYRILRKSTALPPGPNSVVKVHYRGTLDNGSVFDTSYDLGRPLEIGVRDVIPGWTEGLQLIGERGKIELEIPPNLGYGAAGSPPKIPPNSTLHFIIELVSVTTHSPETNKK
jgi:FKBP-type peptidyl-prolyl cis-trans isomerase FkpA